MSYGNVFAFDSLGHDSLHLEIALGRFLYLFFQLFRFNSCLVLASVNCVYALDALGTQIAFSHSSPGWGSWCLLVNSMRQAGN